MPCWFSQYFDTRNRLRIDRRNFPYYPPSFLQLSHHTCLMLTRGVATLSVVVLVVGLAFPHILKITRMH